REDEILKTIAVQVCRFGVALARDHREVVLCGEDLGVAAGSLGGGGGCLQCGEDDRRSEQRVGDGAADHGGLPGRGGALRRSPGSEAYCVRCARRSEIAFSGTARAASGARRGWSSRRFGTKKARGPSRLAGLLAQVRGPLRDRGLAEREGFEPSKP